MVSATRNKLVLYTAIYPAVGPYLRAWSTSVFQQTDRDFDLWVSIDSLEVAQVLQSFPTGLRPDRLIPSTGKSPAAIRIEAIEEMADSYDAVIFVDADDLLHRSRVEAARHFLKTLDVAGCALQIVDDHGREIGVTFGPEAEDDPAAMLPTHNVFGLSNTAYRSAVLRRCLPLSADSEVLDWQLATLAFTRGATLGFDCTPRMYYRQYAGNFANVLPPFSPPQVSLAATRILDHYRCLLDRANNLPPEHRNAWIVARDRAEAFHESISCSSETLDRYVRELNKLRPRYIWWWCVAHPELEAIWRN